MAQVKYKGITYTTRKELCKELGLNYQLINMRMSRGNMTLAKAVKFKPKTSFIYNKTLYRSHADLIKRLNLGITTGQFNGRLLSCGGSIRKALAFKAKREIEYKGIVYPNFKNMCDNLGINYGATKSRMNRDGMSVHQAVRAA